MNYKLSIAYNGSNYHGWSIQPNVKTIQKIFIDAIRHLFGLDECIINCCGRTDAGVHAIDQVINIKHAHLNIDCQDLRKALQSRLPYDIDIRSCVIVNEHFNARFDCLAKTYMYVINTNKKHNVFSHNIVYQYKKIIDIELIKKLIPLFIGTNNFLSFSTSDYEFSKCFKTIFDIQIEQHHDNVLFYITGNGFLRSMVRMIVGTFLAYNENRVIIETVRNCFQLPQKGKICYKAPACGLYLYKTYYRDFEY